MSDLLQAETLRTLLTRHIICSGKAVELPGKAILYSIIFMLVFMRMSYSVRAYLLGDAGALN